MDSLSVTNHYLARSASFWVLLAAIVVQFASISCNHSQVTGREGCGDLVLGGSCLTDRTDHTDTRWVTWVGAGVGLSSLIPAGVGVAKWFQGNDYSARADKVDPKVSVGERAVLLDKADAAWNARTICLGLAVPMAVTGLTLVLIETISGSGGEEVGKDERFMLSPMLSPESGLGVLLNISL